MLIFSQVFKVFLFEQRGFLTDSINLFLLKRKKCIFVCIQLNEQLVYLPHMHTISNFPELNQYYPPHTTMWSHVQLMLIVKTYFRIRFQFPPRFGHLIVVN